MNPSSMLLSEDAYPQTNKKGREDQGLTLVALLFPHGWQEYCGSVPCLLQWKCETVTSP